MKRPHSAPGYDDFLEHETHCDDIDMLFRRYTLEYADERRDRIQTRSGTDTRAAERWERLTQRVRASQHLQTLVAHMLLHGSELRRSALFLRPWSALTVPFA